MSVHVLYPSLGVSSYQEKTNGHLFLVIRTAVVPGMYLNTTNNNNISSRGGINRYTQQHDHHQQQQQQQRRTEHNSPPPPASSVKDTVRTSIGLAHNSQSLGHLKIIPLPGQVSWSPVAKSTLPPKFSLHHIVGRCSGYSGIEH